MSYISTSLSPNKKNVLVWDRDDKNERFVREFKCEYYFYIPSDNGEYTSLYGEKLEKLEFNSYREMNDAKSEYKHQHIEIFESDIAQEYKILSNYYYGTKQGKVNFTLYDIEVDYKPEKGFAGPKNPYAPISSIQIYHEYDGRKVVYAVPSSKFKDITIDDVPKDITDNVELVLCENEKELLKYLLLEFENSDIISGWNSDGYDAPYIYERLVHVFGKAIAKQLSFIGAPAPYYKEVAGSFGRVDNVLVLSGRTSSDYMLLFKKFERDERPSYALEAIADELLPELPKLEYDGSLHKLYNDDFFHWLRYGARDTDILKGLEDKLGYMQVAIDMSYDSGANINDVLGTIKVAAQAVMNYAHDYFKVIVPDSKINEIDGKFTGALVLTPQVGMHRWITSIDLASLYPMVLISLNASPETLIGQFIEENKAHEEIFKKSDEILMFKYENGEYEEMTATQWRQKLLDNNWSVSGFGTVFDLSVVGLIPSLLLHWYDSRIKFKKLRDDAKNTLENSNNLTKSEINRLQREVDYYENLQYIKKIQLNSFYGAIGNQYFKLFDIRIAESTTRTGRGVLMHMVKKIGELLDGEYAFPSESTIYSDTDSVLHDTNIYVKYDGIETFDEIESIFNNIKERYGSYTTENKEFTSPVPKSLNTVTLDLTTGLTTEKEILTIYRHKLDKATKIYRISTSKSHKLFSGVESEIFCTGDHSLMVYRNNSIIECSPKNIIYGDELVLFRDFMSIGEKFELSPVDSIYTYTLEECSNGNYYVYDVVMKDKKFPHFIANNALVHNSCYFKTHTDNVQDATMVGKAVEHAVNKSFPDFMNDCFLLDDNHNKRMFAEQEIVADNSIFVKPKHYLMHIVKNDGFDVDKMKIMGLALKKTTVPKFIKVQLVKYIEQLLKGRDWEKISKDLVKYRKHIKYTVKTFDIGLPKGVNKVEEYTEAYQLDNTTRLPGHVAASIFWNHCIKHYNDKESFPITSGMKIKVFYLKKKFGRFKSIAIPTDIHHVPDWFVEHFDELVDREAQAQRLIENTIKTILWAIDLKMPTGQSILFDELVEY